MWREEFRLTPAKDLQPYQNFVYLAGPIHGDATAEAFKKALMPMLPENTTCDVFLKSTPYLDGRMNGLVLKDAYFTLHIEQPTKRVKRMEKHILNYMLAQTHAGVSEYAKDQDWIRPFGTDRRDFAPQLKVWCVPHAARKNAKPQGQKNEATVVDVLITFMKKARQARDPQEGWILVEEDGTHLILKKQPPKKGKPMSPFDAMITSCAERLFAQLKGRRVPTLQQMRAREQELMHGKHGYPED